MDICVALQRIRPKAQWTLTGETYEGLEWLDKDTPKPTEQEILNALDVVKLEQATTEYRFLRELEYPPIGDQLDALFKAGVFPTEMAETIRTIKNKYPKPSPHPSWIWNTVSCFWSPPTPYPTDGKRYVWDEATTSWVEEPS